MIYFDLALQPAGLPLHILHHYVVYLPEGGTVFQHLPGLVCVEVYLYKRANRQSPFRFSVK